VKKVVKVAEVARPRKATKVTKPTTKKSAVKPQYKLLTEPGWVFVGRCGKQDLYVHAEFMETRRVMGYTESEVMCGVSVTDKLSSSHCDYNDAHAAARKLAHEMGIKGF